MESMVAGIKVEDDMEVDAQGRTVPEEESFIDSDSLGLDNDSQADHNEIMLKESSMVYSFAANSRQIGPPLQRFDTFNDSKVPTLMTLKSNTTSGGYNNPKFSRVQLE
jgi:hypothetical protein